MNKQDGLGTYSANATAHIQSCIHPFIRSFLHWKCLSVGSGMYCLSSSVQNYIMIHSKMHAFLPGTTVEVPAASSGVPPSPAAPDHSTAASRVCWSKAGSAVCGAILHQPSADWAFA